MKIDPRLKAFVYGIVGAAAVVLGNALITLDPNAVTNWSAWLHSLGFAEALMAGHYFLDHRAPSSTPPAS